MRIDTLKSPGLHGGVGLALLLGGAALAAFSPLNSWLFLLSLVLHLGGLICLYSASALWMKRFSRPPRGVENGGCGIALLRMLFIVLLLGGAGVWLWSAGVDMNEMRLLLVDGRHTNAQVIGHEIVPKGAVIGYVDYAYRATPTRSIQDRFPVPYSDYAAYRMGQPLRVTYAAGSPQVHRLGDTDWVFALIRLLYWLLLLLNGAGWLLFPLWLLEFRRPAKLPPR